MTKNIYYDITIKSISKKNSFTYIEQKVQKNDVIKTIKRFLKSNISTMTLGECVLHNFKNKISIPFSKFKTKESVLCVSYYGYDIEIHVSRVYKYSDINKNAEQSLNKFIKETFNPYKNDSIMSAINSSINVPFTGYKQTGLTLYTVQNNCIVEYYVSLTNDRKVRSVEISSLKSGNITYISDGNFDVVIKNTTRQKYSKVIQEFISSVKISSIRENNNVTVIDYRNELRNK